MGEKGPEQASFDFEEEEEKGKDDKDFWKNVGDQIDKDIYCKVCNDQQGGCPQCGFGRGRKENREKAA